MIYRIFIGGLILLSFQGCAKIGQPTGGPLDKNPPVYLSADPENRSLNFSGDEIEMNFDEYFKLEDENKEILISPPMGKKPVIRIREKSVRVTFNEDLHPQTTYTLNFGKALSDLNESNALPDFEFVFSTGTTIDSLSVTGSVIDGFTHKSESETPMMVMLYENLSDSAVFKELPKYYGRANKFGLFAVNNVHADTFRVIALMDENNNLMYDQGLEKIAFSDSMLIINPQNVTTQTFIKDTVKIVIPAEKPTRGNRNDTASVADTIIAPGKVINAVNVSLFSFMEENSKVFITSRERESEKFTFIFNRPLYDSLQIKPLNFSDDHNWYMLEASQKGDTLTYWITDTVIAKNDTLRLELTYLTTDSIGLPVHRTDSIMLRNSAATRTERTGGGRRAARAEAKTEGQEELILTSYPTNNGILDLNSAVVFTAARPIKSLNSELIEMYRLDDTIFVNQRFMSSVDTGSLRKFQLSTEWEEETNYKLLLKPGSVTDIYGHSNDSVEFTFATQKADYYGNILLNFSSFQYPMIIQVLNVKEEVVRSAIITSPGIITFNYMLPGKYSFKAIYDANRNGKWDTGNYLKQIQPEKVYLSGTAEQLRSNWDWEPTWSVTK
jgi:hypothetical protein